MQIQELILNIKQKRKFRGPRLPRRKQIGFHKLDRVRNLLKDEIELDEDANVHLRHFEDKILHDGYSGAEQALGIAAGLLDMLEGHTKSAVNITSKWDGAPALLVGRDSDGKFIMGDKGIFAKTGPRIMGTPDAIDANKPGDERSGLRDKLKLALVELPKIFPSDYKGLIQGDLLFTSSMKQRAMIDDEEHISFTPNTLTYTVPANSDLGNQIDTADVGIVFHTRYPKWPESNDPVFGASVDELTPTPSVWFRDAKIHDVSGQVTLTAGETAKIRQGMNDAKRSLISAGKKAFDFIETTELGKDLKQSLEAVINASIKQQGTIPENAEAFANSFISRFEDKTETAIAALKKQDSIDKRTQELEQGLAFFEANRDRFIKLYEVWLILFGIKGMFSAKLNKIKAMDTFQINPDGSYDVVDPEGFVAVDHIGNAVKIVDRLGFSAANFKSTFR